MINDKEFLKIIDSTPLVSIDLIIENQNEKILLGKRVNRPAQDYWFVPGGRIVKNEKLASAIKRISSTELGETILMPDVQLLGAFDHIYKDNFLNESSINTHYVVLAYKINCKSNFEIKPDNQHSEIKWWSKHDLLNNPDVHQNTKNYFTST